MMKRSSTLAAIIFFCGSLGATAAALAAAPAPAATAPPAAAREPAANEVTLTGTLGCGKCSFKVTKACQNVLKVKDGAKETTYFLAPNATSLAHHEKVCGPTTPATVTGVVSKKAGKKVLTASAIKFD